VRENDERHDVGVVAVEGFVLDDRGNTDVFIRETTANIGQYAGTIGDD